MVDLKDTTVAQFPATPGLPTAFPRDGAKNVLENQRVRIWDYTWRAGTPTPRHMHDTDTIEVFVTGGTIQTISAVGRVETRVVAFKDARFMPRGRVDVEQAVSGSPRAMVIELK